MDEEPSFGPKRWFPSFNPNDPSARAVGDAYRDGREAGLREAAAVANSYEPRCDTCPGGVVHAILALIDAKERHSKGESNEPL